jgi:hypothetical protein
MLLVFIQELLDWKSVSVFDWDVSKHQRAFEHPKMYEAALAAVGAVPEADLYFVEETSRITGGNDRNIDLKVPTLELQATLVALLNSRRPLTNQVHLVRYAARDAVLGNTSLGQEFVERSKYCIA